MDKEQYVTYKVAQLLKEKGFPQSTSICNVVYKPNGKMSFNAKSFINPHYFFKDCYIFAPTQQMAMAWLREVHNIFVTVIPSELSGIMDYTYLIYRVDYSNHNFKVIHQGRPRKDSKIPCEDAVEAALEYALKNLI